MKRIIATAALGLAGVANAAGLSFVELSADTIKTAFDPAPDIGLIGPIIGDEIALGKLSSDIAGTVTFTFLGFEAGNKNKVDLIVVGGPAPMDTSMVGSTVSAKIDAGDVDFKFFDNKGGSAINGGAWTVNTSIGLITSDFAPMDGALAGKKFQYVLGFNDSGARLDDWDDYVIGVNITPVPEPSTYALMFAGLAAVGFVARRRRSSRA